MAHSYTAIVMSLKMSPV